MMKTLSQLMLAVVLVAGPSVLGHAHDTNPSNRSERSGSSMMMGPSMNHGDATGRDRQSGSMESCPMMQTGQCPMMQGRGGMDGHGMMGGGMMGGPPRPNDQWRQPESPRR